MTAYIEPRSDVLLVGGPQDGLHVTDDTRGVVVIAVECFSWDGVDLASYRIDRDRTTAHYEGSRRVWPRPETGGHA